MTIHNKIIEMPWGARDRWAVSGLPRTWREFPIGANQLAHGTNPKNELPPFGRGQGTSDIEPHLRLPNEVILGAAKGSAVPLYLY